MTLWIDGDSCPRPAMEYVFGLAAKGRVSVTLVADRAVPGAAEAGVAIREVPHGSGLADDEMVAQTAAGDVAVTRDLELADRLLAKGLTVMNDRGRVWDTASLTKRLEEARIMQAMRSGGMVGRMPGGYGDKDLRKFTGALNRILN